MTPPIPRLVTLLLAAAAATLTSATYLTPCVSTCRFTFCMPPASVDLSAPSDVAATAPICLQSRPLTGANSGEALVRHATTFVPISRYTAPSLSQPFAPHFFKTLSDPRPAVAHEVPQPGQRTALDRACIALPLTHVQLPRADGDVDNLRLDGSPLVDCVSFTVLDGPAGSAPPRPSTTVGPTPDPRPTMLPPSMRPTRNPDPTVPLPPSETPRPSEEPLPSVNPLPSDDMRPSVYPRPSDDLTPSETPMPLEPELSEAPQPTMVPRPTRRPTRVPRPTRRPSKVPRSTRGGMPSEVPLDV